MAKAPRPAVAQRRRVYVKEWRLFRGLTQAELAQRCGVSHGAVSQVENGLVNYTQPMLELLAASLGCDPSDLISRAPGEADSCELWVLWQSANQSQREVLTRVARLLVPGADTTPVETRASA